MTNITSKNKFIALIIAAVFLLVSVFGSGNSIYAETAESDEPFIVENFTATGTTYKKITFNWDINESADGYEIHQITGSYSGEDGTSGLLTEVIADITDNQVTSYVYTSTETIKCFVVPYRYVGDEKVTGTYKYFVYAAPMDLSKTEYEEDNTTPIIHDIEVLTQKTSKPGVIEVSVSADGTGSAVKTLYASGDEQEPVPNPYFDWTPNYFYYLENTNICSKEKLNDIVYLALEGEGAIEVVNNGTVFETTRLYIKDAAGNTAEFNMNYKEQGLVTVDEEFDVECQGTLSNKNVVSALQDMEEGKTAVLTIDSKSKGILKKELLEAITGQDKTIVVYCNDDKTLQWVFYGKDISGNIKNLDLNVTLSTVNGSEYGSSGKILKLVYADNGDLPEGVTFRVKSKYLTAIYGLTGNVFMYYQNAKNLVSLEDSNCKVLKDGSSYWCYLDLSHNSTFLISGTKLKNTITSGKIKLSKTSYTYDGKTKKPSVTVKNGSVKVSSADYTVTGYSSGRKNVGTYYVTVKGKNNYSGTAKASFNINPKGTSISKLTKAKKSFKVSWKKAKYLKQTTGYQICYSTSKSFSSYKTVTVKSNKTTSKTIKSLKAKKKYYVKVRTYKTVSGKKYYSSWSSVKTVTTK